MHESTYGLRHQAKIKEASTTVFGKTGGGTDGGTVLKMTIQDEESSDPVGTIISYII